MGGYVGFGKPKYRNQDPWDITTLGCLWRLAVILAGGTVGFIATTWVITMVARIFLYLLGFRPEI
jgi:hypothetical protein